LTISAQVFEARSPQAIVVHVEEIVGRAGVSEDGRKEQRLQPFVKDTVVCLQPVQQQVHDEGHS
jgi:hypothetical protein